MPEMGDMPTRGCQGGDVAVDAEEGVVSEDDLSAMANGQVEAQIDDREDGDLAAERECAGGAKESDDPNQQYATGKDHHAGLHPRSPGVQLAHHAASPAPSREIPPASMDSRSS